MLVSRNMSVSCRHRAQCTPARSYPAAPRIRLVVLAHGHGHGQGHGAAAGTKTAEKQEKEKGFINEMRMVAMKLHTKDQAPKEGGKEAAPKPQAWVPTREGYARFLAESQVVYQALEEAVRDTDHPEYAAFRGTGLERSAALAKDLAWFKATYGIEPPKPATDGPGAQYAAKIRALAKSDPPAFICHYYNFYFAHTAGGRMIGSKVAQVCLDNAELAFYQWEGDVNTHLDAVRRSINALAESWSEQQKAHCLEVTEESFKYSGVIMGCITETA
mmetsp:Transcript_13341/g.32593  ORF Transcript_13341/g.32593 Transcript_13341/m.32593 type:complete len:273 (-) Transcript_13341:586-1404(-)